jgi:hypothetical protein
MKHDGYRTQHSGAFGSAVLAFMATALLFKLAWWLLAPAVLAGAVERGAISASLSWGIAALVGAILGTLVFFARHPRRHQHTALRGASRV